LTLLMSDSLNATVIVIVCVLTISANAEPELPDPVEPVEPVDEPPSPPADELPVPPPEEDELDDDEPFELLLDDDPADTESPAPKLESETIVPLTGANSRVATNACSALRRLALAP
jgi:hypothetical protein